MVQYSPRSWCADVGCTVVWCLIGVCIPAFCALGPVSETRGASGAPPAHPPQDGIGEGPVGAGGDAVEGNGDQEGQGERPAGAAPRVESALVDGFLISVPLPINLEVDTRLRRTISRVVERLPQAATSRERPVVVLEFDTSGGANGEGSELERCLSLARYLSGPDLNRVRTVAYVPAPRLFEGDEPFERGGTLVGHAVLVAIACEELVLHADASIGAAGIDEPAIDSLLLEAYRSVAERRRTLPVPVVLSFLDRDRSLFRATTDRGVLYVDRGELSALETEGVVVQSRTLSEPGSFPIFSSTELLDMRLIRDQVVDRRDLASRFNLADDALQGDPSLGDQWRAVSVTFEGPIDQRQINWAIPALEKAVAYDDANLVIFNLRSDGGSLADCLRLAQQIADLDPTEIRTVAYVDDAARGGAAVIALACDHLVMRPDAILGGPTDSEMPAEGLAELESALIDLAQVRQRDWSIFAAVLDPTLVLKRYRNAETGRLRLLTEKERDQLEGAEIWVELGEVNTADGLTGEGAERLLLARYLVADFQELKSFYQLTEDPTELEPTLAHMWIEELGRELASPWIAGWLLFAAMFFLSTELTQPGVGIPGFVSAICFVLFFWSQYCDGNVQWFEVLLLIVGALFVLLELFVLPGFGVFGIGGLAMIIAALFLATQTFIVPNSREEINQLPGSLAVVVAGIGGIVVAMTLMRRVLPHVPLLNRMILTPPSNDPAVMTGREWGEDRFANLIGKYGVTVTRLSPSGKALVDGKLIDVISDGRPLDKDAEIRVAEVRGNHVLVEPAEPEP